MQEILQTFSDPDKNLVAEVAVRPIHDKPGLFQITTHNGEVEKVIYRRRMKKAIEPQTDSFYYDGFPDSKLVKILIRNDLFPDHSMGHTDGKSDTLCTDCNVENQD